MKQLLLTILGFMLSKCLFAQSLEQYMWGFKKYPVVIAVVFLVFIGIIFFLIYLERKSNRFEP